MAMRRTYPLLSMLLLMGADRPAATCDCPQRQVSILLPRDGASLVPTNVQLLVSAEIAGANRWWAADATAIMPNLRLLLLKKNADRARPQGREVKTAVSSMLGEAYGTVFVVRPEKPLAVNSNYALVVATGAEGQEVKTISAFTTGAGTDVQPPVFAGIEDLTAVVAFRPRANVCDNEPPFEQLTWKYGEATDETTSPGDLVRVVYVQKKGEQRSVRLIEPASAPSSPLRTLDNKCDPFRLVFQPGEELCASVEVMDAAGNVAGGSVEKCMVAKRM
ncbi:MAG: hypothetical protein V2A73_19880 [Pseudomonadota bacterium]